jgi:hypothetical protein
MNAILEKLQNLKILASAASAILFFGMTIGYMLAPQPQPKEVVCSKEIEQVQVLSAQIKSLRQDHAQRFKDFQEGCIMEQNKICSEKILRYRAACLELKCEVCRATK